jgi:ABC-type transport system involved in multi-copper enzyme maturation permease subunit
MTSVSAPSATPSRFTRAQNLLTAEWIKLWSMRSTYLALIAAAIVTPLIPLVVTHADIGSVRAGQPHGPITIDPLAMSFRGIALAQLIVATLGALTITGEYSSGLIRSTFAAAPRRGAVLAAKYTVVAAATLTVGQILAFGCVLATQAELSSIHQGLGLDAPGVLRATVASGCFIGVVAVMGLAIGALVRHTATAIGVIVAFFFLIPNIAGALPSPWNHRFADSLPSTAAQVLSSQRHIAGLIGNGASVAVLCTYAALTPLVAAAVLLRRDA